VNVSGPSVLVARWRSRAEELRPFAPAAAAAFEMAAAELEGYDLERAAEVLTLERAAEVSGYSADHLARLIRRGQIPNAGRPRAPRIRRSDLPRKAATDTGASATVPTSLDPAAGNSVVRAIIREIHSR
jgi:hypothetical protein